MGIDGLARADREQPGLDRIGIANRAIRAQCRQHRLLKDVLAVLATGLREAESQQRRSVILEDTGEGRQLPRGLIVCASHSKETPTDVGS